MEFELTLRSHVLQQECPIGIPNKGSLELLPPLTADLLQQIVHGWNEAPCVANLDKLLAYCVPTQTRPYVSEEVLVLGDVIEGCVLSWRLHLCNTQ
jgi:hypothetical protein